MSDEELEQDDLEVGDEEEGEELNAADDGDDSLDEEGTDSERATPTKKAKAKSAEPDELPSLEAKQKSAKRWRRPWKSSWHVAAAFRRSNPMWSPTRRRSRIASTAAVLSELHGSRRSPLLSGLLRFSGALAVAQLSRQASSSLGRSARRWISASGW